LRHYGYDAILNLKIGNVRTIQMIGDSGDYHVQQFASICFSKKRFGDIEQGTQSLHPRSITLALVIHQCLPGSLNEFIAF